MVNTHEAYEDVTQKYVTYQEQNPSVKPVEIKR